MSHPFLTQLQHGVVLTDGAMGTVLYDAGTPLDDCFDALNLSSPAAVSAVHRAYLEAGADIIETNTFGANRFRLETFGLGDKVRQINRAGVRLARDAREVAGVSALVAGSIGPTARTLAPIGMTEPADVQAAFQEQIEAMVEAGVDLLVIETIGNLEEMAAAISAARAICDLPIVANMTFAEDGRTIGGSSPEAVVEHLVPLGVTVLGANCSVGPQRLLPVMAAMARRLEQIVPGASQDEGPWLSCLPNAGWPAHVAGRVIYPSSPEYFGSFAQQAAELGVRLIGGCCGTTPAHTRAMREAISVWSHEPRQTGSGTALTDATPAGFPVEAVTIVELGTEQLDMTPADEPSSLARKLQGGKFLVAVEIDPPKGLNPAKALDGARLLREAGVDAINVADSPMARVRMSALTICYLIQHQVGVETILHLTTRDRSLMGLQSDLLGAHAVGVRTILALTGDPPSLGDYPDSSAVYDIDSTGLIRVLSRLNTGTDSAGASIGKHANFLIACAVDPTRADLEHETSRLRTKLEAGANFVMTQPIFDPAVWRRFLDVYGVERLPVPVLIGILPLQSTKHAEFLHNEVPGITLTDSARDRMRRAGAEGRAEGVKMARELLLQLRPTVQGVYLMPSFGRYEVAAEVLQVLD